MIESPRSSPATTPRCARPASSDPSPAPDPFSPPASWPVSPSLEASRAMPQLACAARLPPIAKAGALGTAPRSKADEIKCDRCSIWPLSPPSAATRSSRRSPRNCRPPESPSSWSLPPARAKWSSSSTQCSETTLSGNMQKQLDFKHGCFAALRTTGKRPCSTQKSTCSMLFDGPAKLPMPPCRWRKRKPSPAIEPMPYAELQVTTNYSFLRGGSHPGELVFQAANLGHYAIGIADRNTLAGVVRAYAAVKEYYEETGIPEEPVDQAAGRRPARNPRRLFAARLSDERRGLQAAVAAAEPGQSRGREGRVRPDLQGSRRIHRGHPGHRPAAAEDRGSRPFTRSCASSPASIPAAATSPAPCCSAATMRRGWRASTLSRRRLSVRLVATNDVHYHVPERRALHDVVTAIRLKCTVEELGFHRFASAERHLKPARGDAPAVPRAPAGDRVHSRNRRSLPFQPRSAPLPVSRRVRGRRDADAEARAPDLEGRRLPLPRGRSRHGRSDDPARVRPDRAQGNRAVLPDRARDCQPGARDGHPLPGPRLGRQFRRLLLPAHHRGRSRQERRAVRALPVERTRRAARHRRRFRARAARGHHPVDLPDQGADPRRPGRHGDRLSQPQRHPRRRQGARPVARHLGRDGQHGLGQRRQRHQPEARRRGRHGRHRSAACAGARAVGRADRLSAPPLAACRRLRADGGAARRAGADPECGDGRTAPSSNGTRTTSTRSRSTRSTCWRSAC